MSDWQPTAALEVIRARAELYARIRAFFTERGVMEVDTPVLSNAAVSDPYLLPMHSDYDGPGGARTLYLQTSPEYAMKRLLAAGSGCIYQLAKAFRNGESGALHNPEFCMLEWYRVGFTDSTLMDEIEALLQAVFVSPLSVRRCSYGALFQQHLGIDPHTVDARHLQQQLQQLAAQRLDIAGEVGGVSDWLNLLFSHLIEPQLIEPTFVYDYPACQAALARVERNAAGTLVAKRFELFIKGTELANGYHELTDGQEQAVRFAQDQQQRRQLGMAPLPTDAHLVAALNAGLPACAGVALGVDRLLMLLTGHQAIDQVLAFPLDKA